MMRRIYPYILIALIILISSCSSDTATPINATTDPSSSIENRSNHQTVLPLSEEAVKDAGNESEEDDESMEEEGFDDFEDEFAKEETYDPLESYNRTMTGFNDGLYIYVLDPVARGYRYVVPEGGRLAVDRFIDNILYPVRFSGSVLQAKFSCAGVETTRFLINTTIGLLGFFDPAKAWFNLNGCEEDFGQALGYWDVGAGPHIVLPFYGPSNLRDLFAMYPESYVDPISQMRPYTHYVAAKGFSTVNYISLHIGEYDSLKRDAVDFYILIRDAYEQLRQNKIKE